MKRISAIILVVVVSWVMGVAPAWAQSSSVTATVRPNPLEVEVQVPSSVSVGEWFEISALITNEGLARVNRGKAEISVPGQITIRGKNSKGVGNLKGESSKTVSWKARATEEGHFFVQVDFRGVLEGEEVEESDTALVSSNNSLPILLNRLIARFRRWGQQTPIGA